MKNRFCAVVATAAMLVTGAGAAGTAYAVPVAVSVPAHSSTVEERIVAMVVDHLAIQQEAVPLDARFVEDLGADELDVVELIAAVGEEFDIAIPEEDAEELTTTRSLIDYVNGHQG